jgi:two-component system, OmpR family, response regulator RstA
LLNKKPTIHLVEFSGSSDNDLKNALADDGIHLVAFRYSDSASIMATDQKPDLVLLNLTGDQGGSFACCRDFRSAYPQCAIYIIHDGLSEWEESVALELGADAIIGQTADLRRVMAQIRALLRRHKREQTPSLELNSGTRMVNIGSRCVSLTDAEFELLKVLARDPGTVVSRDTISQHLRGLAHDDRNRIIDLRIARIRQKLGDDARHPRYIRTVRGEGYMLMTASS